jgi:hypothetical protein
MSSEFRGYWEAPRWANVSNVIKNAAHINGLECSVEVDKGWIRECGRYVLRGDEAIVSAVGRKILKAMEEYNK